MQKKYFNFQPKGMNTNMSPKFQSNEYATYSTFLNRGI